MATEYSLKFDESMTEDEIEERSFRSLLPSEAHRRGTKEKKSRHQEESEDDASSHNKTTISGSHNILKVREQCCTAHMLKSNMLGNPWTTRSSIFPKKIL